MSNPTTSDRGLALILVIGVIAALVVSGTMLNRQVRGMLVSSAASAQQLKQFEMCRSGIEAAVQLLESGSSEDVLGWMLFEDKKTALNDVISSVILFPYGTINISITDESARIQINALATPPNWRQFNPDQRQLWERFLGILKSQYADEIDFSEVEIIDALKDWLDSGDDDAITGLSGAENDYYETLPYPHRAANAPIQHIGELLQVKGVPSELYHGTDGRPGLSRYVTALGASGKRPSEVRYSGRINMNTAEAPVIAALLPIEYQSLAESIVSYRQERIAETDNQALSQPTWYKNAPGCGDLDLPAALITTSSDLFRISVTAVTGQGRFQLTASVQCRRLGTAPTQTCDILRYE